jgi:hypothetical protein
LYLAARVDSLSLSPANHVLPGRLHAEDLFELMVQLIQAIFRIIRAEDFTDRRRQGVMTGKKSILSGV